MPRTKPVEIKPKEKIEVRWSDIAGVDDAKKELQEVVDFLKDPEAFQRLGAQVPAGVILHGPPGTGKTLLAKAVAAESGATFYSQSASSFVEMFAGLGAARIRRLFREARKHEPAIVFIDELDAVGARRGSDNNSEREQTLNQLLVEMDGFGSSDRVVVMAASNLLEKLDPALLRPGRFDRQVFVSPPDMEGRRKILGVHTANKPLHQDIDLDGIAAQTSGLCGAELANLCNEAAIFAGRRGATVVETRDFEDALERVVAGVQSNTTLERARAPDRRLPRGRPRALPRAAGQRRADPQDLDRPARQRARLRHEPARRGLVPEDARAARRPDDDPARRARRRGDRLRRGDHGCRQRPAARRRDHARDGPRLRHGHGDGVGPGRDRRGHRERPDAPDPRRGAAGAGLRGPARRLRADHGAPGAARGVRAGAARARDARPPRDRHDHGGRAAGGAPVAAPGRRRSRSRRSADASASARGRGSPR